VASIASSAMEEQAKAIGRGTMDPQWAASAIAEAWCYATMSLTKGYLDRLHAQAIIGAIEAFIASRLSTWCRVVPHIRYWHLGGYNQWANYVRKRGPALAGGRASSPATRQLTGAGV